MSTRRVLTAERDRNAQPDVPYGEVKFSNPYDQEIQALANSFAKKFSPEAADVLHVAYSLLTELRKDLGVRGRKYGFPIGILMQALSNHLGFTSNDFDQYLTARADIDIKYGPDAAFADVNVENVTSDEVGPAVAADSNVN